jgi:outer membrane protein assembly factor BamD
MKMNYIAHSLMALLFSLLVACSGATDPSEAYKGETGQQIFQGGEDALRDNSYGEAIKRFEALDVQYPFGRNTEIAQLHIIYAYYKNSDFLSAETAADRFIHAYPSSQYVPYALYLRGLSTYYQNMGVFEKIFSVDFATRDLTQVKKAFNDFSQIESRYPNSAYAAAAHQYLIYLRNVLANHQVEVAQFYYNRQAYIAAANRASLTVEHYQGSPAVPDALVIMAKSYHQLHQTDLENDTIRIINLNYPGSVYSGEVTGSSLNSQRVTLYAPRLDRTPSPQQAISAPPVSTSTKEVAANYQSHNNGYRGSMNTVADLVKRMRGPKPQAPEEAQANKPITTTGQAKKPAGTTLADMWKKLNPGNFVSQHSKTEVAQADLAETAPEPDQLTVENPNGARH